MDFEITKCNEQQLEIIKKYIKLYELDDRELLHTQFLLAIQKGNIIGFGRIRKHNGCDEFCSLGVIKENRHKGIAQELILARIKIATQPIYLVTITPQYFIKFGFTITENYPSEIRDKLNYCTSELVVPETYVVMTKS